MLKITPNTKFKDALKNPMAKEMVEGSGYLSGLSPLVL